MNYRHAFHAGNFADVFKHALLTRILVYLTRKDTPLLYLDTHAGSGLYDLDGDAASRSPEWRDGIGRLDPGAMPADVAALLAPYLRLVFHAGQARPSPYPGSPLIARDLLRAHDRLVLCETHPEEALTLSAAIGRDRRATILERDGYAALNALLPPKERRGLVLIDPPYEVADETQRLQRGLAAACRKWPTGVYALWYPIKDPDRAGEFADEIARLAGRPTLRLELYLEAGPKRGRHAALALVGCGLLVVNPPYGLDAEARLLLAYLSGVLARAEGASWRVEAVSPPR